MATNTVIFDQAYKILVDIRTELRQNYDVGNGDTEKRLFFRCNAAGEVVRCCEDDWLGDEYAFAYPLQWSRNNKELRAIARDIMEALTEEK